MWPIQLVMDLTPSLLAEIQFQVSLLRLMCPRTRSNSGSAAQVAELERLQEPVRGIDGSATQRLATEY